MYFFSIFVLNKTWPLESGFLKNKNKNKIKKAIKSLLNFLPKILNFFYCNI